jgi:site-specific DNA recombinase
MVIQLLGVFAEFEREVIIDRVINGVERKAAKANGSAAPAPTATATTPRPTP